MAMSKAAMQKMDNKLDKKLGDDKKKPSKGGKKPNPFVKGGKGAASKKG